jgi:hypothetical protein
MSSDAKHIAGAINFSGLLIVVALWASNCHSASIEESIKESTGRIIIKMDECRKQQKGE